MAEYDAFSRGLRDENDDGVHDDVDRRPGNRVNTPEYAEVYDPRNEYEYTNALPEIDDRIREAETRDRLSRIAKRQVQSQVHFWPSVGKFIIPDDNSWAAHEDLVQDDKTGLAFNIDKYLYFDNIIADKLKLPALTDTSHPDYMKYEDLRTNFEVLRNDIIGIYMDDGSYDPGDEKFIPRLAAIATELGNALAASKSPARFFVPSLSLDVAGIKGVGAAQMYQYLLARQEKPGIIQSIVGYVKQALGVPDRDWGLPGIQYTPFSEENLAKPAPPAKEHLTQAQIEERCAKLGKENIKTGGFVERLLNEPVTCTTTCQKA